MAHALRALAPPFAPAMSLKPHPTTSGNYTLVRCGPRDNRGPLVKGRILSTEAIQAIQSLKRAYRSDSTNLPSLSRLIKADLLATLRELLRQDQCTLALHVFSAVRAEYPPVDLNLYADVVSALARNGLQDEIDGVIRGLERVDGEYGDKGLIKLLKGVIAGGRRESTVRVYELMRESGWGSETWAADPYVVEVLSKGLRRLGEQGPADEVEAQFGGVRRDNAEKQKLRV